MAIFFSKIKNKYVYQKMKDNDRFNRKRLHDIYLAYNFKDFECAIYIYIYIRRKERESPMFFGERIELTITCDRSTVGTVPSMMSEESRKQPNEHEATGGSF